MHKLIYSSRSTEQRKGEHIDAILAKAQSKNKELGLTGLLLYSKGYYIQYLEGDRKHIDEVFASISADTRHKNVVRLIYRPAAEKRLFSEWNMGFSVPDSTDYMSNAGSINKIELAAAADGELVLNYFRSFSREGISSLSPFG